VAVALDITLASALHAAGTAEMADSRAEAVAEEVAPSTDSPAALVVAEEMERWLSLNMALHRQKLFSFV
jgi:hypothetical protein